MSELHPSDVVLLALAAGTLDEVQRVAIDDHVRGCARCRAFVRAMEHVGGIVLGRLPPTPLANELLLSARLDQHDAFLFPHWVPFRSEGTLRLAPTFSDYAHNVHDVEVNFLLTEGSERDWSIRRCTLTDIALQFGRTGASTIADGIADRSDAIVFAIQSSMLSDHVIMNGQKASASDIAVLPPGCDFIFTGRAAYDWISIILPIKNLPSELLSKKASRTSSCCAKRTRYSHLPERKQPLQSLSRRGPRTVQDYARVLVSAYMWPCVDTILHDCAAHATFL